MAQHGAMGSETGGHGERSQTIPTAVRLFLGIDGGQSSTSALIGDESGKVLGGGTGGPCNHAAAGEGAERLRCAITESVSGACAQAGLARTVRFAVACCGMSGGPDDKRAILEELLPADRVILATDAEIALAGATTTGRGIIVIAGTGSIAFGRNEAGTTARVGGWGYLFGDEGSAYDIVRRWSTPRRVPETKRLARFCSTQHCNWRRWRRLSSGDCGSEAKPWRSPSAAAFSRATPYGSGSRS